MEGREGVSIGDEEYVFRWCGGDLFEWNQLRISFLAVLLFSLAWDMANWTRRSHELRLWIDSVEKYDDCF